ncbi:hypothetical protein GCM10009715_02830 [Paeniglutamicibacter psychrophenolicus]
MALVAMRNMAPSIAVRLAEVLSFGFVLGVAMIPSVGGAGDSCHKWGAMKGTLQVVEQSWQ